MTRDYRTATPLTDLQRLVLADRIAHRQMARRARPWRSWAVLAGETAAFLLVVAACLSLLLLRAA